MNLQPPYRIGVIGLGVMGERLLTAMLNHPHYQVAAVCDASAERAQQVSNNSGGVPWYTDHRQLLAKEQLDLVYLAVPPKFHHSIALDVLACGKHLLCEKPLANSLEEAEEMVRAAKQAGVIHAMNFPLFYRPVFAEMKERLAGIGSIRRIDIVTHFHQWPRPWQQTAWLSGREQGGFVREVMPHFIHFTLALFGRLHNVEAKLEYPEDPTLCETGITATMQLADGTTVTVNGLSQIAKQEHLSYTVYGTEGTLSVVNWSKLAAGGFGEPLTEIPLEETDRLAGLLDNLAAALAGQESRLVSFDTGYEVQQVLEALLNSK
jgi:predicted dehydrogenase